MYSRTYEYETVAGIYKCSKHNIFSFVHQHLLVLVKRQLTQRLRANIRIVDRSLHGHHLDKILLDPFAILVKLDVDMPSSISELGIFAETFDSLVITKDLCRSSCSKLIALSTLRR